MSKILYLDARLLPVRARGSELTVCPVQDTSQCHEEVGESLLNAVWFQLFLYTFLTLLFLFD